MYKILMIDDERDILEMLALQFQSEGYLVYLANDANEALKQLSVLPDLILLDINMPEMNGLELCTMIREHVNCPIIFLTARISSRDMINGLMLGGDDYITKPFSAAYLKARIFNLIDQRKKLQALFCASLLPTSIEQQPSEGKEASPALSPNDRKFMDKVMKTIEKHLDNGNLMVEDIANEVNMRRSVFFKKLKTLTVLSPVEFLKEIRMKRAAQLIETDEYSMAQIAYMVGLNDSHYFSKCFKQQYGITPTEYKESRKPNMD